MPGKQADFMTPDRIRREIVDPLHKVAADIAEKVRELEHIIENQPIEYPFIEQNTIMTVNAIDTLKKFLRIEVTDKIEQIKSGQYRWRKANEKAKNANKGSAK